MFNVDANPEFTHTVRVQVPVDGGHEEQTFKARFRLVEDDVNESVNFNRPSEIIEYLRTIIVSFDDLADKDKKPIQYNDSVRDQMLKMAHVRIALLRTYRDARSKERLGN